MAYKTIITELYEVLNEKYITLRKTEDENRKWYTLEKENKSDGRNKSSIDLSESELTAMLSMIKTMLEAKQ